MTESSERPFLRVVRGTPDEAELAALTAVVIGMASAASSADEPTAAGSRWADRAALVRQPLRPGPGAWRAAGFPR